jgi:hypothetical protein
MNTPPPRPAWFPSGLPLPSWEALWQVRDQVVTREPGQRRFGPPQPVGPEARRDWLFAWLSQAAYGRTKGGRVAHAARARKLQQAATAARAAGQSPGVSSDPDPDTLLRGQGWQPWEGFPDGGLLKKIDVSHLRVEVWENRATRSVAVAFGGTVFSSGKDWKSNLRWFIPHHHDEYTEIVHVFGPAFLAEYQRRAAGPDGAHLHGSRLFSTGHSLGGGLAQQFAYALPVNAEGLRTAQVYAFDPSPVTGFFSVKKSLRDANRRDMAIDRIYERGEVLAYLRSLTSFVFPPSAVDPTIRAIRFNLFPSFNPIRGHSMMELALQLNWAKDQPEARGLPLTDPSADA